MTVVYPKQSEIRILNFVSSRLGGSKIMMHHEDTKSQSQSLNELSYRVIGLCLAVHRELGPGLLESAYEEALVYEFTQAGIRFELRPVVYAKLLREKMEKNKARCILLNTGWSGGPYGTGKRISIKDTRALLNAALRGDLDEGKVQFETHPVFNMRMPTSCPGVDAKILNPRNTWTDKAAYDVQASKLRDMFRKNFEDKKFSALGVEPVM